MDPLKMLMMVVPGTPGEDYPILDTIPETSFRCEEVATAPFGYYADTDPASGCQVSDQCLTTDIPFLNGYLVAKIMVTTQTELY